MFSHKLNKFVCMFIFAAIVCNFTACTPNTDYVMKDYTEETEITTEYSDFVFENVNNFHVYEYKENGNNIEIVYPIFSVNGEFGSITPVINENIQKKAISIIDNYDLFSEANISVNFEIFRSKSDIISVVFKGTYSCANSSYPVNIIYSANIDPQTGELVKLSDFADAKKIIDCIKNTKNYKIVANEELKIQLTEYIENLSSDELDEIIANADKDDCLISSNVESSDNSIALNISVPHALGDYMVIVFDKNSIIYDDVQ